MRKKNIKIKIKPTKENYIKDCENINLSEEEKIQKRSYTNIRNKKY